MFCISCGASLFEGARFCANCGQTIQTGDAVVSAAFASAVSTPHSSPQQVAGDAANRVSVSYAGFWQRAVAAIIDALVSWVFLFVLIGMFENVGFLLGIVGVWLYFALQESSAQQATLGKRAVGIIVTDQYGAPLTFGRATGRFFSKYLSGMFFGIGYLIAAFTARKQALHDLIASTLVLRR